MRGALAHLIRLARVDWVGPHFWYDLIRLARKGWPTFARVLYLAVLLVSLSVMYRTQENVVHARQPAEYARIAQNYAYTLIVLQNILVLVLLPVYVASAIAEEKENQTLEALTLTHLTDRELVLGKLCARLMHLGAVVLSSFPLLVFMHLWGNVEIAFLVYHEVNTLLLLASAGSVCIWKSTNSDSVFQAISGSYPWMAVLFVFVVGAAFVLPVVGSSMHGGAGDLTAAYLPMLPILIAGHMGLAAFMLHESIRHMEFLRKQEQRKPRKTSGALSLTDDNQEPDPRVGKRGQVRSRIHAWAWPISGHAIFWKECIKDGTDWSLSTRWLAVAVGIVVAVALVFRIPYSLANEEGRQALAVFPLSLAYAAYFVALAAYALVVIFQMTMTVAGEREHDTLTFLLLVPEERKPILWYKWLGPWWRNWPILAISYLGVLLGLGCGLFGFRTAFYLLVLPWPFLLMLGGLGLWLSVVCRRVLFANIAMVGFIGILLIVHLAAGQQTQHALAFHVAVVSDSPLGGPFDHLTWLEAGTLALGEQVVFLAIASMCVWRSFRIFARRDYAGT